MVLRTVRVISMSSRMGRIFGKVTLCVDVSDEQAVDCPPLEVGCGSSFPENGLGRQSCLEAKIHDYLLASSQEPRTVQQT